MTSSIHEDMPLYEQVFLLLQAEEDATPAELERRSSMRSEFGQWQLIAPYVTGRRPRQPDFRFVECCDLSPGGFSFVAGEPMDAEEFVIALGAAPFKFFVAKVTNRRIDSTTERSRVVIGCKFVRRFI